MLVLLGVVIGALLGAVLSYVVARAERLSLEKHRQMSGIKALVAEIREVQEIAKDPRAMTRYTLTKFPFDAWHLYKQHMEILPQFVQQDLLSGYSKLNQANNIADWALYKLPFGNGALNDPYRDEVRRMCDALEVAEKHLQEWLQEDKAGNALREWLNS